MIDKIDFTSEDRKLIIEHDVKLSLVCISIGKLDDKIDSLISKLDDNIKTYITKKMFLSINGLIIGLLLSLFVYTHTIDKQVVKNIVCIEKLESSCK